MANKIAIAGLASILVVACVVAAAVTITKRNSSDSSSNSGDPVSNDSQISTSTKSVQAMCQPTDYKEACEKSLASAKNTSDPKELIKVAFESTITDIKNAMKNTSLIQEAAKDPRTKDALQTCESLLNVSIDDLRRSFDKVGTFDINKIKDYTDDLKTWISASITYQETCLDAFENTTGETGEKMKKLLKTAGELTSNGLAMVSSFGEMLTNLHIPGISRRLLTTDSEYTSAFVEAGSRRLLQVSGAKPNAVVAQDGSGQYKTIKEALKAVPPKNNQTYVILIKAGEYKEMVDIPRSMINVVFIGEGPTKTKITGNKNFADGTGTYHTATVAVNGDGFVARDIGFENTAGAKKHQAVALRVSADKTVFYNCNIDGYQDTLYTHSYRQFYKDCTITGTIDFIFGDASAVFQNCKMIVRKPGDNQACMVTAQGRKDHRGVGAIVLQNCDIRAEPAFTSTQPPIKAYLGRPWKEYSRTIIMQSYIDAFIDPEGWAPWNGNFALNTLFYAEYQNRGPGANIDKRVKWGGYKRNISPQEAEKYAPAHFIDQDNWIKKTGISY
ncbi:pectinesterase [Nicotiana sylvestris]|uniref:Pectinesterase n=1 Tax=Nicotiana sylvestris TaxID=4096 RepID=A0A1U7UYV5_NICSY|nr:PREDICTED: pectinesterase [Nicotiana sylvestris]XP_016438331.1 PREDICTED: pectinesterase-like [Nicotiana tabacum]